MNKMNLRLRAYDLILKTLVALTTTLIVGVAHSETETPDVVEDYRQPMSDIVERYIPVEINAPYKIRRENDGFLFSIGYENVEMYNYMSLFDFTTAFHDMFGEIEIPIYNMQLGYKYNFMLGAMAANLGMGYGTYSSPDSGIFRTLSIIKYTLSASYIMDNIFDEPYAAPYATFGVNQFSLTERAGEEELSTGIEAAYFTSVGVLIQLNWLDSTVARRSLMEYGLENTYLDLYVSQFQPSIDETDPNTETEYTFGAGLKLEF